MEKGRKWAGLRGLLAHLKAAAPTWSRALGCGAHGLGPLGPASECGAALGDPL